MASTTPSSGQALGTASDGSWNPSMWSAPRGAVAYEMASPFLPRASCIPNSSPLTSTASSDAPRPICAAARRVPSARRSPTPSRRAIMSSSRTIAGASPQSNRKPISCSVRIPFSKHSMAKAIALPALIVSRPYTLQRWLSSAMDSRLGFSQSEPKAATVSYSGPPYSGRTPPNGPSATRTTRVQPTGQDWQARCPRRIVFFMAVPLIRSACSQVPVSQLRVGRMPAPERSSTPPAVPRAPALLGLSPSHGCFRILARLARTTSRNPFGSASVTRPVPRMAMALRFFAPITAPSPVRPAARSVSFMTQA